MCQGETGVKTWRVVMLCSIALFQFPFIFIQWLSGIDKGFSKNKMMQLGNNRSRERCVSVDNWALAHLLCETHQTGRWFLTALLQLRCHGSSPPIPVAANSEASETAHSDGSPVESVARWLVTSFFSSLSTVDKFQLTKLFLKIASYIRRLLGWINIPEFYFSKWMILHGHMQNQWFFLLRFWSMFWNWFNPGFRAYKVVLYGFWFSQALLRE